MPASAFQPHGRHDWTQNGVACLVLVPQFVAPELVVFGTRQFDAHRCCFIGAANIFVCVVKIDIAQLQDIRKPLAINLQIFATAQLKEIPKQGAAPKQLMFWIVHIEQSVNLSQLAGSQRLLLHDRI